MLIIELKHPFRYTQWWSFLSKLGKKKIHSGKHLNLRSVVPKRLKFQCTARKVFILSVVASTFIYAFAVPPTFSPCLRINQGAIMEAHSLEAVFVFVTGIWLDTAAEWSVQAFSSCHPGACCCSWMSTEHVVMKRWPMLRGRDPGSLKLTSMSEVGQKLVSIIDGSNLAVKASCRTQG